jgi:hypothetical protein
MHYKVVKLWRSQGCWTGKCEQDHGLCLTPGKILPAKWCQKKLEIESFLKAGVLVEEGD